MKVMAGKGVYLQHNLPKITRGFSRDVLWPCLPTISFSGVIALLQRHQTEAAEGER